jgi:pyruvate ferredoxin oxidoreductase beta subunit
MVDLKKLSKREPKFVSGHRACAGCGAAIIARQVMMAVERDVVVGLATGCLEIFSTIFPYSSWNCPLIHNAFENVAATISGAESAYKALKKKGKIKKDIKFIALAGDGGTYDIGLQSLSGALERGHDMLYICYDNQGYSNTGFQRSSATPFCAETTTAPVGKKNKGKMQNRKDITEIVAAHNIPYVAQTAVGFHNDLINKIQKALSIKGPKFINILSTCVLSWDVKPEDSLKVSQLAVESGFWPLYEIENGVYKINYEPLQRVSLATFFKLQGRYKHLLKPENKKLLLKLEKDVELNWQKLVKKVKCSSER